MSTIHPFFPIKASKTAKPRPAWSFLDSLLKTLSGVFAAMHKHRAKPPSRNAIRHRRRLFF